METLLLIRHSLPEINPETLSTEWVLSDVGRKRCNALTNIVKEYSPQTIVTSNEMKAFQTGAIVAKNLDIPVTISDNLHEHERDANGFKDQVGFEQCMADFFRHPNKLIFGKETAQQALERFSGALEAVMGHYLDRNLAVVTHGTVLTLWVTHLTGEDPFTFWELLGMPALVVISRPELELLEVIDHVE